MKDDTVKFTCGECGTTFTVPKAACKVLFLDFPDGKGGLTGNRGVWHDCPKCGKHCGNISK